LRGKKRPLAYEKEKKKARILSEGYSEKQTILWKQEKTLSRRKKNVVQYQLLSEK